MVERGPYRNAEPRESLEDRLAQQRYRRARLRFLRKRQSVDLLVVALFFWELLAPTLWWIARPDRLHWANSGAALRCMIETVLLELVPLLGFVALARRLTPRGLLSLAARVTALIAALIGAAECALLWDGIRIR
jgi:hypothetical protein